MPLDDGENSILYAPLRIALVVVYCPMAFVDAFATKSPAAS
jgi:hypothetical protein